MYISQATWSTGCPRAADLKLGAPGAKAIAKKKNETEKKEKKEKKSKKKKLAKKVTIKEDNVEDSHIEIKFPSN